MKGHIRERSPGCWAIVLDHCDSVTGQRKRRWHSFRGTKRAAEVRCAELVAELQSGTSIDPNKIVLGQFLDRFQTDWVANHVSPHSGERYGYVLNHVRQHLGGRPLQKLRPVDLAALYATLAREGLAPRTSIRASQDLGNYPRQPCGGCQATKGAGSGNVDASAGSGGSVAPASPREAALPSCLTRLGHRAEKK